MIQQNTKEWLELRKSKIGASDAPIIIGESPWKTAYQLWEEKLGIRPSPQINEAMKRGHELETIARKAYVDYTGTKIVPEVVFHQKHEWMMASLDGLSTDRSLIVEIKCPGQKDHDLAKLGKIPKKYYAQLQHQLATIELNELHYFSYRDGDIALVEVVSDKGYIKKLYDEELDFWNKLQSFEEPALSERDCTKKSDHVWIGVAQNWISVNAELADLKDKEKAYREELIRLSENQSCHGGGIRVQKITRKGSIDYSSIPELGGVELDKYRKSPTQSWRLSC